MCIFGASRKHPPSWTTPYACIETKTTIAGGGGGGRGGGGGEWGGGRGGGGTKPWFSSMT